MSDVRRVLYKSIPQTLDVYHLPKAGTYEIEGFRFDVPDDVYIFRDSEGNFQSRNGRNFRHAFQEVTEFPVREIFDTKASLNVRLIELVGRGFVVTATDEKGCTANRKTEKGEETFRLDVVPRLIL